MADDPKHEFGGIWTEIKLAAISAYSKFFTTAISQIFDTWYVDPFAGTGQRNSKEMAGGLFENEPISEIECQYPGSAAKALAIQPPFAHYRLGDAKKSHAKALQVLADMFPDRDAQVVQSDGNTFIQEMFSKPIWQNPDPPVWETKAKGTKPPRALVFLDPYGMEVQWATLKILADSQKADVWFLANIKGAVQQLCHRHESLDAGKRNKLREYFGTDDWEAQFYETSPADDLFGFADKSTKRVAEKGQVVAFHKKCLEGIFRYVSDPLPLAVGAHDDYFLLYCISS